MAGAYTALLLPPYSPELNPVERWFEALRATLSNQLFATIDALDQALTQAIATLLGTHPAIGTTHPILLVARGHSQH